MKEEKQILKAEELRLKGEEQRQKDEEEQKLKNQGVQNLEEELASRLENFKINKTKKN